MVDYTTEYLGHDGNITHPHQHHCRRSYNVSKNCDNNSVVSPIDLSESSTPVSNPPTAADWERYQPIITELYCDKGLKLEDVMKIMRENYGFVATIKMFSGRRTQWKLFKNMKRRDVTAMLAIKTLIGRNDETRPLLLRGRHVDMERLRRSAKRKRISKREIATMRHVLETEPLGKLRCTTILRLSRGLDPPDQLKRFEGVFRETDRYIRGSLEMRYCRILHHDELHWYSFNGQQLEISEGFLDTGNFESLIVAGISFYKRGYHTLSWRFWQQAFRWVDYLREVADPAVLVAILMPCMKLHQEGHSLLARVLLRHFGSTICATSDSRDPRHPFISTICQLHIEDISLLLSPFIASLDDIWRRHASVKYPATYLERKTATWNFQWITDAKSYMSCISVVFRNFGTDHAYDDDEAQTRFWEVLNLIEAIQLALSTLHEHSFRIANEGLDAALNYYESLSTSMPLKTSQLLAFLLRPAIATIRMEQHKFSEAAQELSKYMLATSDISKMIEGFVPATVMYRFHSHLWNTVNSVESVTIPGVQECCAMMHMIEDRWLFMLNELETTRAED